MSSKRGQEHAYDYFSKLKNTVNERSEEVADPEGFMQDIDTTHSFLKSNLEALSQTYSGVTEKNWAKLNIRFTGLIDLKPNYEERIAVTTPLGKDELWSSANLNRHLCLLESLTPRKVC